MIVGLVPRVALFPPILQMGFGLAITMSRLTQVLIQHHPMNDAALGLADYRLIKHTVKPLKMDIP